MTASEERPGLVSSRHFTFTSRRFRFQRRPRPKLAVVLCRRFPVDHASPTSTAHGFALFIHSFLFLSMSWFSHLSKGPSALCSRIVASAARLSYSHDAALILSLPFLSLFVQGANLIPLFWIPRCLCCATPSLFYVSSFPRTRDDLLKFTSLLFCPFSQRPSFRTACQSSMGLS